MQPKTGKEPFHNQSQPLPFSLIDFWAWSQSDLNNNALRGIIAEFIVMKALGIESAYRIEWDAYDFVTETGLKIEVKSSAYLQSWEQAKLSKISFGIAPTQMWDSQTNIYAEEYQRWADFYVFCLLHHKEKATLDPLNMDQWTFYLLPTEVLNQKNKKQATITLGALLKLQPVACKYGEIKEALQDLSKSSTPIQPAP
jgi:hypothetical protein